MVQDKPIPGRIEGLRLPSRAWTALQRANITTIDQLRAVADRIERVLEGIGPKTARTIGAELARVATSETQSPDEDRSSGSP